MDDRTGSPTAVTMQSRPSHTPLPFREDCWSEDATYTLVEAWGDRYLELNRGNLLQKHWQEVADAVNARHGHNKKARRTDVQCKNRIDTLKKKYKVEKAKIMESDGTLTSKWPFYDRLDALIGSTVSAKKSSPPLALPLPYRKTPPLLPHASPVPVAARSAKQKRPAPAVAVDDSFFRQNYSAVAAAAAADAEDSESSRSSTESRPRDGDVDGFGHLAQAITRFGEIYERVEGVRQRQMIELEKQRMQFAKDLEFQRMQLFMDTQVQLEKIKRAKRAAAAGKCEQDKKLKELFDSIPSPDELYALGMEGLRADIILVDSDKDKKVSMLKQLIVALVKGLNSNPAAMIKKIAGLVSDVYKRPNSELSPAKAALDEISHMSDNRGIQMPGQLRHGSCRPRAILFKVLADTVGLESRLMVGIPGDGLVEPPDSYKHMSVIVMLNSVELLVDLMRFLGQLIPCSTKTIFMSHISAAGESDSAENDSCDSPLEPNSPLYGFSDRADAEGGEQDEGLQSLYQRKLESYTNVAGPSLRNVMLRPTSSIEGKMSLSHSEPNIANAFWRRSRRKVVAEQRTASSSPEHPLFRARGRSMLSGDRQSFRESADDIAASRSDGASKSESRRIRRRSISITPEIGDDIVRAVRAMNETLKQNRLVRNRGDDGTVSYSTNNKSNGSDPQKNESNFHLGGHDEMPGESSPAYTLPSRQISSQKAISLPLSPHEFRDQASERSGTSDFEANAEMVSTWNKVLESSLFINKPLLPFEEWNIDFTELTVGTRVGIGFFGEVFRGIWNGTDVAIKIFLEQDLTAENMEDFCNEISILSRLRHPNGTTSPPANSHVMPMLSKRSSVKVVHVIIKSIDSWSHQWSQPPRLSMVTEYMEMGSLYYLIHMSGQKKKLGWRRRLKMLREICRGLMCIHRMKIVHRDLKSANCLVNKHWTVKICDFGLSRVMTERPMKDSASAGTPEWMAPELIRNEPFTEKCDVFSLGVIMWELCTLNRPWEGVPPVQVVYAVNEGSRLEIPEGPLGKLIADCWAEPDERPRCEEILSRLLDCEYTLC